MCGFAQITPELVQAMAVAAGSAGAQPAPQRPTPEPKVPVTERDMTMGIPDDDD